MSGSLLGGAFSPFEYRAESLTVWLSSGDRPTTQYAAVRILGRPLARLEPTPTEVPAESPEPIAWQRVPTDVAIAGGRTPGLRLVDVATTPAGLVAVGKDDRGGVVVTSPDGVQWTRLPDSSLLDGASLVAVAVRGQQMLVVGPTRILLWGTADGTSWTGPLSAATGGAVPADVAAAPSAWVIAGTRKLAPDATGAQRSVGVVRWSANGRTWVDVQLPGAPPTGDYHLTSVAYLGSRFVALGRDAKGLGPEVLVWTSKDGRTWRRGADIPVAQDGEITDLAPTPDGTILAVGAQSWTPVVGAAFTSLDGSAWSRVPDAAFTGAVARGVTCDARRCVAVGETKPVSDNGYSNPRGAAVTWTSPDGRAWTRAATTRVDPATDASWGPGVGMERVVRSATGLIAFGWATVPVWQTAYADRAATWVAPARVLPAAIPAPAVPSIGGRWEELPRSRRPGIRLPSRLGRTAGSTCSAEPRAQAG